MEFARKGLAGARVEEIAREAGVTKQLVYHYYNSKEGLFVAVLDESSDNIMSELVNLNVEELSPPVAMRAVLNHFLTSTVWTPSSAAWRWKAFATMTPTKHLATIFWKWHRS